MLNVCSVELVVLLHAVLCCAVHLSHPGCCHRHAAGRRRLLLLRNNDGTLPLIFAAGSLYSDGTPRQHSADGAASLPLLSGGSTGGELHASFLPLSSSRWRPTAAGLRCSSTVL